MCPPPLHPIRPNLLTLITLVFCPHTGQPLQGLSPQIRKLWKRTGEDCHWEHPRAPSVRRLWKDKATEAVLKYLEDTRWGAKRRLEGLRWMSAGTTMRVRSQRERRPGRARLRLYFPWFLPFVFFPLSYAHPLLCLAV